MIRTGDKVQTIGEAIPEYKKRMGDLTRRMQCLRVAVHPQIYPYMWNYFQDHSFADIVREVYGY